MTAAHSGEHTGRSGPDTDIDLGADPESEHYEVFLSYNGDDEVAVERVARRLRSRKVEPWLDRWHLVPGTRWQTGIPQGLARSASCAVFIGPSSLGAWEREEVDIAVDRATRESGFRVIPVLLPGLEPFDPRQLPPFLSTRTWVDLRQGVDDERGLQQLVQAIRGIPFGGGALRDEGGDDVCPFRGLSSFEEEQAAFYFGREGALQRLVELFRTGRMAAVVGPSGSGKSSLVKAGLVPRVRDGGLPGSDRWTVRVLRPGAEPVTTLGAALTSLADDTGMAATVDSLTTDPRTLHLGAALALRNAAPEGRLLLVVDQFEEIFTLCLDDRQRSAFLANLGYATSVPGGRVVTALTLRADFYPRLAAHPAFSQLVQNRQLLLGMPGPDGLRQAIEGPSRYVGLDIEAGLVETILEDVGTEPGTLPLLQQALLETWRNRSGNLLALEGYQRAGGVRRALAERADRTFVALTAAEQACAQRLFLRLVQPGTTTEDTRRRITLGEIVGSDPDVRELTERVIRRFVHERLLTIGADPSSDEPWLEVAHEALIRAWPTLRGWIDADRAGLQLHRSLTAAAQDWHTRDRDESTLFRGRRLTETLEWSGEAPRWLSSVERAFLTASEELDVRVARARTRQLITAAVALVVVLVIVSTAALIAVGKAREATRQRDLATSGELSVRADVERDVDPARSVALALRAMDAAPTAQAEAALRQSTLAAHLTGVLRGHQGRVQSVAVSPDGVLIASGGDDGTVRLWRTAGGTPSGAVETRQGTIYSVRFSPDGRRIATAGRDGSVVVVDLDSGSMRPIVRVADVYATSIAFVSGDRVVAGFSDGSLRMVGLGDGSVQTRQADPTAVYGLAATRDGTGVAVAGASGAATIWTVDPFAVRLTLPDEGSRVANVAFGPTGDEVATAGEDGTVRRWTAADGRLLSTWPVTRQAVYSLAYSPDGRTVAATGEDGVVALWSVTGTVVATLRGHAGNVYDASFSPRERLLVSAGRDGTVRTWDPGDAVVVAAPATRGSFSRDGTRVVTGGTDGAVRVWRTGAVTPDAVLTGHRGPSWARFFPDGRRIVSCGEDGTVRVWDSAGPPQVLATHTGVVWVAAADPGGAEVASGGADGRVIATRLAGGSTVVGDGLGAIYDVAYSSDGTRLLAAGEQGNVYVWDLTGPPRPPLVLSGAQGAVFSAAFDPSGSRIVAAGADGTARTWDVGGPGASPGPVFGGHQGAIEAVAFSSDGSRIASAGIDGTVRMWDAATGRQLVTVTRHDGQAASVSVAPDGRHLLSVGESDGTVRTSDCPVCGPIEEVLTLARSRAIES